MRSFIRMIALAALIATGLFWYTQGAHTGWNQSYVSIQKIDEVTGLEYTVNQPRFVPGIEFIGGSVAVVVFLFASSFLFGRPRRRRAIEPTSIQKAPQEEAASNETEEPTAEPDSDESGREDDPDAKKII